jgi:hypothetical protein
MAVTYTAHGGRRYRYYVCWAGRKQNGSGCAGKFLAARALEESVIEQVRSSLKAEEARQQLGLSDAEWQSLGESVSGEGIRNLIRRVSYDGARGAVSVELGP